MRSFKVPGAWVEEESDSDNPPSPASSISDLATLQTAAAPAFELLSSPETGKNLSSGEEHGPPLPPRPERVQSPLPLRNAVHTDLSEDQPSPKAISRKPTIELQNWQCNSCDEEGSGRFYCNICQYIYCEDCWKAQLPHRKLPNKPGQLPHEQTDLELERRIRNSLRPNRPAEENARLHRDDESATWFGLAPNHDRDFESELGDSGRLEELISSYKPAVKSRLHPSLVSFIGQTGKCVFMFAFIDQ